MLDVFVQLQLGIHIPPQAQRAFLLQNCGSEIEKRGFDHVKLAALDGKLLLQLLKEITMQQYLTCVPFRVFGFDLEFTGPPVFRGDGPTEDILELGLYSPERDTIFSRLVHPPRNLKVQEEVTKLTGISNAMLKKEGVPFAEAWREFCDFLVAPDPSEPQASTGHILLLSHGGKLADQALIRYTLDRAGLKLPRGVIFGDTIHMIRDAHRRRPVTVDRHPPTWGLGDLVSWLNIPPTLPAHRAGNDAKMTWDALYHTLLRYGDDTMSPKQQLVSRFFDAEAKAAMREIKGGAGHTDASSTDGEEGLLVEGGCPSSSQLSTEESESLLLDTDFDRIFEESGLASSNVEEVEEAALRPTKKKPKEVQRK